MEIKTPIIEIKMTGGTRGIQGEKGIPGKDGENGATFTPTVSTDGVLHWDNDKGLPNPLDTSIKGPEGEKGSQGYSITRVQKKAGEGLPGTKDTYGLYIDDPEETEVGSFEVYNGADGEGSGDMSKSVYDTNNDGIVDNAEKVNGHTVEKDVPENAQFTDTTNYEQFTNKPQINNVELLGNKTLDELGIQEKGNYALQEAVDAIEGQVQETENIIDNLSDSINNLSNTTNELNNKIDKIVLKSLSDIGLSEFTTLDAIVTAVPNGKTLQLYLTTDNATTLYNSTGGNGNIPAAISGLLTVEKRSENGFAFIKYQTTESLGEPDNNSDGGVYYTTKFNVYRDWVRVGKNIRIKELYSGSVASTTTVTLSDNYDNYDMIVAFVRADYNNYKLINWYKGYYGYKQNCTVLQSNGYCSYGYIGLNSDNKCTITSAGFIGLNNLTLDNIIGINFDGKAGDE